MVQHMIKCVRHLGRQFFSQLAVGNSVATIGPTKAFAILSIWSKSVYSEYSSNVLTLR